MSYRCPTKPPACRCLSRQSPPGKSTVDRGAADVERLGPADEPGDDDLRPVARSPEKGAKTLVWLATSSAVANVSGVYFFDQEQTPPSPEAQDTDTARWLWEISERQCAISRRSRCRVRLCSSAATHSKHKTGSGRPPQRRTGYRAVAHQPPCGPRSFHVLSMSSTSSRLRPS
jgi:hypothetical protein